MSLGRQSRSEIQALIWVTFNIITLKGGRNLPVLLTWSSIQTKAAEQYFSLVLGPLDQMMDNAIHWIELYQSIAPLVSLNTYPLDSNLYGG